MSRVQDLIGILEKAKAGGYERNGNDSPKRYTDFFSDLKKAIGDSYRVKDAADALRGNNAPKYIRDLIGKERP